MLPDTYIENELLSWFRVDMLMEVVDKFIGTANSSTNSTTNRTPKATVELESYWDAYQKLLIIYKTQKH